MRNILKFSLVALTLTLFIACSDDDGPTAQITINEGTTGDLGGDFTGNGGSISEMFTWQNGQPTADYNADITATSSGVFRMSIADADGTEVLNRTLGETPEPDSFSGVTAAGTAGEWTVTITVTNFNGDGSFSVSAGN